MGSSKKKQNKNVEKQLISSSMNETNQKNYFPFIFTEKQRFFIAFLYLLGPIVLVTVAIRSYFVVEPQQYFNPCDSAIPISTSVLDIFKEESAAYEKIFERAERFTSEEDEPILKLKQIKDRKNYVENIISTYECTWQKCVKRNIDANIGDIKSKTLSFSIYLFVVGSTLLFISGVLIYYKRNLTFHILLWLVFLIITPIFINAGLSLNDYFTLPNFEIKC